MGTNKTKAISQALSKSSPSRPTSGSMSTKDKANSYVSKRLTAVEAQNVLLRECVLEQQMQFSELTALVFELQDQLDAM